MKKRTLLTVILVLVLMLALNSFFTVRENEYACTVRFSKIIDTTSEPGLHFKVPFMDSVKYFPDTTMLYDIPPSEVLTSDKQNMTVDCYILWHITDPQQFYRGLGTTAVAEDRLDAITYTALKIALGNLKQSDIINMNDGGERNDIYESITTTVNEQAKVYGIEVEDVKIKRFDLPASNENAVYTRMISDAEAQAATLVAEGESEYMKMLAAAYDTQDKQEFYEFILALDALKQSLSGEEKTIILDKNSELARILMG